MNITEKYSNPTRYDLGKYGEIARHGELYFIQVSKDPETANWLTIGEFLSKTLGQEDLNEVFIKECLEIYEKKNLEVNKSNG